MLIELTSDNKTITDKILHIPKDARNHLDVPTSNEHEQLSILMQQRRGNRSRASKPCFETLPLHLLARLLPKMKPLAMSVSSSANGVASFQATTA